MSARLQLPENSLVEARHLQTVGLNQAQVWDSRLARRRRWASEARTNVWQVVGAVTGSGTPLDIPITANPSFTYAGQTFTFNNSIRVHRRGMRMSFTPDAEDYLPADTLVRMWPTADPTDIQQVRLGDGRYGDHGFWDIIWSRVIHPIVITSGTEMAVQFLVPQSAVPPLGMVSITLDDDEWEMWTGNQWATLGSPPPIENLINHSYVGVLPARHYDWEHKPLAILAPEYWRMRDAKRIPDSADSPFAGARPVGDILVGSDSHQVAIYTGGTINVTTDCRVQVLAVGPGGQGDRYQRNRGTSTYPTVWGAGGGGGGEIVWDTWDLKAGDVISVTGTSGALNVTHRSGNNTLRSIIAHQGNSLWASSGGGQGVDTGGPTIEYRGRAPIVLAAGAYGQNRIVGRGGAGYGSSTGGVGGNGGGGHNLSWIAGTYMIGQGGAGRFVRRRRGGGGRLRRRRRRRRSPAGREQGPNRFGGGNI